MFFYLQVADVNDNAPQFLPASDYIFAFTENQPAGSVVGSVNTTDRDSDGPNSLVCQHSTLVVEIYSSVPLLTLNLSLLAV